jgi:hypothetical protein
VFATPKRAVKERRMADAGSTPPGPPESSPGTCARCDKAVSERDQVPAGDRIFCRSCYEVLTFELRRAVEEVSANVNYPRATLGAILGGVAGALVWWGFTVLTKIGFGLIAVGIGFLVGHGVVRFTGGKKSRGLQILAVVVGAASFLVAAYLVNMTFINEVLAQRGDAFRVPFPPTSPELAYRVLGVNFGIMKVVFLAIVMYEAWIIPRPPKLPAP